jgi:hypothetical protein
MRPRLLLKPEAEADIAEAFDWYDLQRTGLGSQFLAEVAQVLETIERVLSGFPLCKGELAVRWFDGLRSGCFTSSSLISLP